MINIIQGDTRQRLAELPADSFDCCVTSPPYWGLRDYGVHGQIGLEPTLQEYLDEMRSVCTLIRRALKPSGTFWLNIGDSYARDAAKGGSSPNGKHDFIPGYGGAREKMNGRQSLAGLKPKDLCMVPNRLAILLQDDGWYVRSEIIWHKPNPMPESVTDRPTNSHEKVWLLTKSERYFYDADAVREPHSDVSVARAGRGRSDNHKYADGGPGAQTLAADMTNALHPNGRNARNVWEIATQPFAGAHFATMAPELAERCIKAGSPLGGSVLDPFGGAGTTGLVADRLGRDATLIELNPEYIDIARKRIEGDAPLFAQVL